MIDINTIISQALAAAVQQATAPLLERIAALESQSAALLNRVTAVNAVADRLHERVAALENQALVVSDAVDKRITALETATQDVGVLLEYLDNQEWFWEKYLDNQEWFWEKIREFTGTVVEQAIENHTECWDHNDFVTEDKLDDYVKTENLESEVCDVVRDIMEGATVSIRI